MKRYVDFTAGMIWGLLFFLIPGSTSGLYGFPLYDAIFGGVFDRPGSLFATLAVLSVPYIALSALAFTLYRFIVNRVTQKSSERDKQFLRTFLKFLIGFYVALVVYVTIGLIGFSQGEFSL